MNTKYLAFAAVAFMLASCSNDEDFIPQDDLKDTPITGKGNYCGEATITFAITEAATEQEPTA